MTAKSWFQVTSIALCLSIGVGHICGAQDSDDTNEFESEVAAPPNTRRMGSTLGGAYFVDGKLLERYEALKTRLVQVREDISLGNATSESAMTSLAEIQNESKLLREELEKKKVLVSAYQVYSQTSEQTFPLGDERLVIVTGDNVIIRGWDGSGIKCVIEKTIVANQQPDDSEFDDIQLKHELTIAEEKVGSTREQRDQRESDFQKSEAGRNLTEEQKENRKKFIEEIRRTYGHYLAFQGREANSIQLTGITYQEGNRNLSLRIKSPGGEETLSSQWQRHATMTVYVPVCKSLAVRGCLAGLDIRNVECDLVLSTADSKDRDYEGSFTVHGVNGNVTIDQVPVRVLSEVSGDVRFTATDEFVNSGTHYHGGPQDENDTRTFSTYETHLTQIDHISGNVQAIFLRTELRLIAIEGILDIVNRYGTTHLTVDTVDSDRAHRIVSESGAIRVDGHASVLEKTPIYAHTQCGRLQSNIIPREILDHVHFSIGQPKEGWHGFVTPSQERFENGQLEHPAAALFRQFERPSAALENRNRSAGLDLISHAGMVSILTVETAE